ncbi:MAG TPA: bifunctional hydroxymethylpyrimidine kinase/phosphomethylpyrimidine kinase [Baekduia sp.]|nr:bifunctional hydroxymethylpyrimidine kinase/phosphomethylpyrimidine kinase [Baekduia sp.]
MARTPVCLTIAGSDSGGGAGIQADLKAFARCGVHGTTAITAVTAQNTVAVTRIEPVSAEMIVAQIRAVVEDIGVDAVKIGMVGDEVAIGVVARAIDELLSEKPVVLDPVMIAESGSRLLKDGAERALRDLLLPRATVITPNLPEARALSGMSDDADGEPLARGVHAMGCEAVVLTGGHRPTAMGEAATTFDLLFDGVEFTEIADARHPDGAAHGSGCTHSSVLAAQLALGYDLVQAATTARSLAGEAVRDGVRDVGRGPGPVNVLGVGVEAATPTVGHQAQR